jgi:hypothetical protein
VIALGRCYGTHGAALVRWVAVAGVLAAAGCGGPEVDTFFVAPPSGTTHVPIDAPLQVRLDEIAWPDGEPIPPDLVQVVDLVDGGFVDGELSWSGRDVLFEPELGWRAGHRYAWTVQEPVPRARQPVMRIPDGVTGEAIFDTASQVEALDAVRDEDRLCLLFSQRFAPVALDLTLDGAWTPGLPVEVMDVVLTEVEAVPLPDGALGAVCTVDPAPDVTTVRWISPTDTPYALEVAPGTLTDALLARHRWGTE